MTDTTDRTAPTAPGGVLFRDSLVPNAAGGPHRIRVEHALPSVPDAEHYFSGAAVERRFHVRASQFTLERDTVHGVYPPVNSTGVYERVLPHVTLDDPSLPWARTGPGTPGTGAPQTGDHPWVALLVFGERELPGDPDALGLTRAMTVTQLLTDDPAVTRPRIDLDDVPVDQRGVTCQTIDVPEPVLQGLLPTTGELPLLAHGREGALDLAAADTDEGSPDAPRAETPKQGKSVVVANRFPADHGQYTAHLVSLEGVPVPLQGGLPHRLVSLHRWHFTSHPSHRSSFSALVRRMLREPARSPDELLLRAVPTPPPPAVTGPDTHAQARLGRGHVPVAWDTPTGERTTAWYRGPFTPYEEPADTAPPADADAAHRLLLYDSDYGVFDAGYAAAWTIGRAVALADSGFATTLVRLRRRYRTRRADLCQYAARAIDLGRPEPAPEEDPATTFGPTLSTGFTSLLTTKDAAQRLTERINGPQPARVTQRRQWRTSPLTLPKAWTDAVEKALFVELAADRAAVTDWLRRLRRCEQVPFSHLFPYAALSPGESIRFCHVDHGWLRAVERGARSLGVHGTVDAGLDTAFDRDLGLLDTDPPVVGAAPDRRAPRAGMLVHSELVRGWPGLLVGTTGAETTILRRRTLAPDLLLVLFDRVPDRVWLGEPHQALHFGTDDEDRLAVRALDSGAVRPGVFLTGLKANHLRTPPPSLLAAQVLDIEGVHGPGLLAELGRVSGEPHRGSADLALQMIRSPEIQTIRPPS